MVVSGFLSLTSEARRWNVPVVDNLDDEVAAVVVGVDADVKSLLDDLNTMNLLDEWSSLVIWFVSDPSSNNYR